MNENNLTPYAIDSAIASLERTIKRLWILCILLAIFLVGTNAAWIYYESQWEVVETTEVWQEIDAGEGDGDVITNGIGDINYGNGETAR